MQLNIRKLVLLICLSAMSFGLKAQQYADSAVIEDVCNHYKLVYYDLSKTKHPFVERLNNQIISQGYLQFYSRKPSLDNMRLEDTCVFYNLQKSQKIYEVFNNGTLVLHKEYINGSLVMEMLVGNIKNRAYAFTQTIRHWNNGILTKEIVYKRDTALVRNYLNDSFTEVKYIAQYENSYSSRILKNQVSTDGKFEFLDFYSLDKKGYLKYDKANRRFEKFWENGDEISHKMIYDSSKWPMVEMQEYRDHKLINRTITDKYKDQIYYFSEKAISTPVFGHLVKISPFRIVQFYSNGIDSSIVYYRHKKLIFEIYKDKILHQKYDVILSTETIRDLEGLVSTAAPIDFGVYNAIQKIWTEKYHFEYEEITYHTDGSFKEFVWRPNYDSLDAPVQHYFFDKGKVKHKNQVVLNKLLVYKDIGNCTYGAKENGKWKLNPNYDFIEVLQNKDYVNGYELAAPIISASQGDSVYLYSNEAKLLGKYDKKKATLHSLSAYQRELWKTDNRYILVTRIAKGGYDSVIVHDFSNKVFHTFKLSYASDLFYWNAGVYSTANHEFTFWNGVKSAVLPGYRIEFSDPKGRYILTSNKSRRDYDYRAEKNKKMINVQLQFSEGKSLKFWNWIYDNGDTLRLFDDSGIVELVSGQLNFKRIATFKGINNSIIWSNEMQKYISTNNTHYYEIIGYNGKYGLVASRTGQLLMAPQYDTIMQLVFRKNGKFGLFSEDYRHEVIVGDRFLKINNYKNYKVYLFVNLDSVFYVFLASDHFKVQYIPNYSLKFDKTEGLMVEIPENRQLFGNIRSFSNSQLHMVYDFTNAQYQLTQGKELVYSTADTFIGNWRNAVTSINPFYNHSVLAFLFKQQDGTVYGYDGILKKRILFPKIKNALKIEDYFAYMEEDGQLRLVHCDQELELPENCAYLALQGDYLYYCNQLKSNSSRYNMNKIWGVKNLKTGAEYYGELKNPEHISLDSGLMVLNTIDGKCILVDKNLQPVFYYSFDWISKDKIAIKSRKLYVLDLQNRNILPTNAEYIFAVDDYFYCFEKEMVIRIKANNLSKRDTSIHMFADLNITLNNYEENESKLALLTNNLLFLTRKYDGIGKYENYSFNTNDSRSNEKDGLKKFPERNEKAEFKLLNKLNYRESETMPMVNIYADKNRGIGGQSNLQNNYARNLDLFPPGITLLNLNFIKQKYDYSDFNDYSSTRSPRWLHISSYEEGANFLLDTASMLVYQVALDKAILPEKLDAFNALLFEYLKDKPNLEIPCMLGQNFVKYFKKDWVISDNSLNLDEKGDLVIPIGKIKPFLHPKFTKLIWP